MNTVILCDMHVQCVCFFLFETRANAIFLREAEIFPGHAPFTLSLLVNPLAANDAFKRHLHPPQVQALSRAH